MSTATLDAPSETPPSPPRRSTKISDAQRGLEKARRTPRLAIYLPLGLYLLFTIVPFYWIAMFAFRKDGSDTLIPLGDDFTLEHFDTVWNGSGFAVFFRNSVMIAVMVLICVTFISLLAGYAMARYDFRAKNVILVGLLCTQFVPGAMLLIPLFEVFRSVNLTNTLWSIIIADTVFQMPLSIMLMTGFIRNVPIEIEEASWIDGCSRLQGFRANVLPLLLPGIVAISSFAFIGAWNNFLFALMFLNSQSKFTIPVGLNYMIGENAVNFGALAAGGVIAVVPVVLVFAYVQKFLVKGMSSGAVKG